MKRIAKVVWCPQHGIFDNTRSKARKAAAPVEIAVVPQLTRTEEVMALIRLQGPQTVKDLARRMEASPDAIRSAVRVLVKKKKIRYEKWGGGAEKIAFIGEKQQTLTDGPQSRDEEIEEAVSEVLRTQTPQSEVRKLLQSY